MSKELEALEKIRLVMKKEFNFPLNLTEEYKIIQEALKRNEPKKLIFVKQTFKTTFGAEETIIVSGCPMCKHGSMYQGSETKYCPNCGQKLDWEKKNKIF